MVEWGRKKTWTFHITLTLWSSPGSSLAGRNKCWRDDCGLLSWTLSLVHGDSPLDWELFLVLLFMSVGSSAFWLNDSTDSSEHRGSPAGEQVYQQSSFIRCYIHFMLVIIRLVTMLRCTYRAECGLKFACTISIITHVRKNQYLGKRLSYKN